MSPQITSEALANPARIGGCVGSVFSTTRAAQTVGAPLGAIPIDAHVRSAALGRADVKAEFENTADEYALLDEFLKTRAAQGLTQAQVAEKIGTTQSAVARKESIVQIVKLMRQ